MLPGQGLFLVLSFIVEVSLPPREGQGWEVGSEWTRLGQQELLPWLLQRSDTVVSDVLC